MKFLQFIVCCGAAFLSLFFRPSSISPPNKTDQSMNWGISVKMLSSLISQAVLNKDLPKTIIIPDFQILEPLTVHYASDSGLEEEARRLFQTYSPDYGVFVAIQPEDGRVLAMVDSNQDGMDYGNLSLINTFPAASISKIITTVAAIEEGKANTNTVIPFNGKSTSFYKRNVLQHKNNQWTKKSTLLESFSKSINTTFGRLGAVFIGGKMMMYYAKLLGFNSKFKSDFEFKNGHIRLNVEDKWEVAQMASGYTRRNTLSPMHAAVIAATAVNGGKLVTPILISSVVCPYGVPLYRYEKTVSTHKVMSEDTSHQLNQMMQQTVKNGSARNAFRTFHLGKFKDVQVGGKTGSLSGLQPKGKYDWFIGFAEKKDKKIAYAVLCINKKTWKIKSTQFARKILEYYFKNSVEGDI